MIRKIVSVISSMLVGALIGFSIGWMIFKEEITGPIIIVYLVLLILFYCFHIIIHEAGHALFGKLTGYELISFRVFNLMWVKDEKTNNYSFKKFGVKGTLGQCLMKPPKYKEDDYPFQLYLLGGVILDGVVSLICLLFIKFIPLVGLFGIVGLLPVISNLVPDGFNDGMTLLLGRKSKRNQFLIYSQFQITYLSNNGKSLLEMPDSFFELKKDWCIESYLDEYQYLLAAEHSWFREDWETVSEILEFLWSKKKKLALPYRFETVKEFLNYLCITNPRDTRIDAIWSSKEMKQIIKAKTTESYLTQCNYSAFVEHDLVKANDFLEKAKSKISLIPYLGTQKDQESFIRIVERKMNKLETNLKNASE